MASNAITETPPGLSPKPPRFSDEGPSQTREDDMGVGRIIGLVSACLVLFGSLVLVMSWFGRASIVPLTFAVLCFCFGLAGMLFHAAFERELELRRIYLFLGFGLLGVGFIVSLLRYKEEGGSLFGIGYLLMILGLIFQAAVLRNEKDEFFRTLTQRVLGIAGGLLAFAGLIVGFFFAETTRDFLLPYGLLLSLLGLAALIACVEVRGTSDELSYRIGLGIGALGALALVLALLRSLAPGLFRESSVNFFLPWGILLMGMALVYVLASVALCSENRLVVMTRRELGAFFLSPIAYLVLFAFAISEWSSYWLAVPALAQLGQMRGGIPEPIVGHFLFSFFSVVCTIFVVPALTMRLLSEENRTGTLEVMLTAPVDEVHVVLSKYFAALLLFLTMWLPLGLYMIALRVGGGKPFDYLPLMSFFIALVFTGANFIAMGLFFSSLTRNQIVSAVLTFAGMLIMTSVFFFMRGSNTDQVSQTVLEHISYVSLWLNAAEGRLVPRYLLFHASMAILWLFATVKVLEARKWK